MPALMVYDGTGTRVWFKTIGKPKLRELRIQLSEIAFNGQDTATFPTFHLGSRLPLRGEIGGMTYQFAKISDPGMVMLNGFWDPSIVLPSGLLFMEFRFVRPPKYRRAAKIRMVAAFTNSAFTIPMNAAATQVRTLKATGLIKIFPAVRN